MRVNKLCPFCGEWMEPAEGRSVMGYRRNGWECTGCDSFYSWNELPAPTP